MQGGAFMFNVQHRLGDVDDLLDLVVDFGKQSALLTWQQNGTQQHARASDAESLEKTADQAFENAASEPSPRQSPQHYPQQLQDETVLSDAKQCEKSDPTSAFRQNAISLEIATLDDAMREGATGYETATRGTRTRDLRFTKQCSDAVSGDDADGYRDPESVPSDFPSSAGSMDATDPSLALIIQSWHIMPHPARQAILVIVKSVQREACGSDNKRSGQPA
jgi:hypothetical protein